MSAANSDRLACPQCREEIAPGQAFCTGCGADLRQLMAPAAQVEAERDRACPYCAAPIAVGQAFCTGCGRALQAAPPQMQAPASPASPMPPTPQGYPQAPYPAPPRRRSWVLPVFGVVVVLVVALCGVCAFSVYNVENEVSSIFGSVQAGANPANEGKRAPTYAQILQTQKQESGDEWHNYLTSLQGMRAVAWTGKVYSVQASAGSGAILQITLDGSSGEAIPNVSIPFADASSLHVSLGQTVSFNGRITYAMELMGYLTFAIDDATVYY